ncbi:MAG: DUF1778 domain-containing protein [Rickettsia endosymbiont of Oxypoda opaca]|nr:DUF1778 domain-containing protein [Rickettsia endosymbiont of Oxypoda opaca]
MSKHTMARLEARVEPKLKNLFLEAAKMQGTSLTNFIIASAKKEAEATFRQQTLISLTLRDAINFIQKSADDSSPNKKLTKAATRFIQLNNI